MGREMTVSDSVVVAVEPSVVWEQVADPAQMGRWSPENQGTVGPAAGTLAVGDVFVGRNRRGLAQWRTECVVTAAEPGRHFAFRVRRIGVRRPLLRGAIATWDYSFEPTDGGTLVTETWRDDRRGWPDLAAAVLDRIVTGGRLFADFQKGNIARTLAALKADLERA